MISRSRPGWASPAALAYRKAIEALLLDVEEVMWEMRPLLS
ncbi:hypothetical protein SMC26_14190 [Actinomadura fulvescens]